MSDGHYTFNAKNRDGSPLSEEQKRAFDAFLNAVAAARDTLAIEVPKMEALIQEAEANGVFRQLTRQQKEQLELLRSKVLGYRAWADGLKEFRDLRATS